MYIRQVATRRSSWVLSTLTSTMNGTTVDHGPLTFILPILLQAGHREMNSGVHLTTPTADPSDPVDDQMISLYYWYFHSAHPCAVPCFAIQCYVASDCQTICCDEVHRLSA